MHNNPFDGADGSIYVNDHNDRIEIYLGQYGHVCIRQTKGPIVDKYPIVAVHPRNIDRLIDLLRLAADHSLAAKPDGPAQDS
jgi:hypothetical protein